MSDVAVRRRITAGAVLLSLALAGLGWRLAFLHLGAHEKMRRRVEQRRTFEHKILAGRGAIYDCAGPRNVLACNLSVKDVCADPHRIVGKNAVMETAMGLAECLDLPTDEVFLRINRPERRFEYIKRHVHEKRVRTLENLGLPGIFYRDVIIRNYPHKEFMCHILGFVNFEGVGSAGIEQELDSLLRGRPGFMKGRVNALREEWYWARIRYEAADKGADVCLNIDENVQYFVEKALDRLMEEHRAKGAWAIVQKVKTGEILAMASRPGFDPNRFRTVGTAARLNRATGFVYEPGSTFKVIAVSAALNEGIITPDTVIHCENGAWRYGGRILRDYHPYGELTVADIIKKSSNIGTAKIALKLGNRLFEQYLKAFGVGNTLGIDLPGEERGILHERRKWSKICPTRIAIGQAVSVTALQVLGIHSAIANNGYLMRPYVINSVTDNDGTVLRKNEPEVLARPITRETARTMRKLLGRVTESGGTGRRAAIKGYRIAGKTGTAEKPVDGGYSSTRHVASFVGFLPADDPEVAMIVVADEPQPVHTGGVVAAPAFRRIADRVIRYLEITPSPNRVAMH